MSTNKDLDKQFDGFVTELGEKLAEPYHVGDNRSYPLI